MAEKFNLLYYENIFAYLDRTLKLPFSRIAKLVAPKKETFFLTQKIWTLPNIVSFSRIPLGLALLCLVVYESPVWAILTIHALAGFSDGLDGALAKQLGTTKLGSIVDPLCDKFYVGLCAIAYYPFIWEWLFLFLAIVEAIIATATFLGWWGVSRGKLSVDTDFSSNAFGKFKFFFEFIGLILLPFGFIEFANLILVGALFFALLSFAGRIAKQLKNKRNS